MFGSAAVAVGGILGFLFGVPRSQDTIRVDNEQLTRVSGQSTVTPNTIFPNTNLEQISDWLTKVLVGVTLAQVGNLKSSASDLFANLATALGTGESGSVFAGALVIYALAVGFWFGWLTTRVWVALMLTLPTGTTEETIAESDRDNHPATGPSQPP
jgi:hypothetical protein